MAVSESGLARYTGPPGQDPAEVFDVYGPPQPGHQGVITRETLQEALGTKARGLVHKDGDWHRSVHIWLVHPQSQSVVIQKRSMFKDTNPGKWDVSAAGHISHGQISQEAARRELEEELGFSAEETDLHYLFTAISLSRPGRTNCNLYQDVYVIELTRDPSEMEFNNIGESEVSDVKFIDMKSLKDSLDSCDERFVVRTQPYLERLFQFFEQRYGALARAKEVALT